MKPTQSFFVLVFTLLCFNAVSAQYGNGYNNGYGGGGYGNGYGRGASGMDRSMVPGQQPQGQQKPKEIPVEETANKIVEQMTPAVSLDELQAIAISNVLADSLREQGILLKNESSNQEQKIDQIKALRESTDKKISAFLNPDQIEKYKTFMSSFKDAKKSKSKKKKDSKDSNEAKEIKEDTETIKTED